MSAIAVMHTMSTHAVKARAIWTGACAWLTKMTRRQSEHCGDQRGLLRAVRNPLVVVTEQDGMDRVLVVQGTEAVVSTAAEQEAERRYPGTARMRFAFVSGWNECESRYRELLEAAREYRDARAELDTATEWYARHRIQSRIDRATGLLWAAAAALDEEGGE